MTRATAAGPRPARGADLAVGPGRDATAYLTVWLVLLYTINARQVVGVFGALGSPALLWSLPALLVWLAAWLHPRSGVGRGPHPMRPALLFYLFTVFASFAVAQGRSLTELEASEATRALIVSTASVGIALVAADGIRSVARLETLLKRLVVLAAAVSVLGILQFATGLSLQPSLPGLDWNIDLFAIGRRSAFNRPAATTLHPIEFSVITAATAPLGLHFALRSPRRSTRRNMGLATLVILFAMPLTLSRTGFVSLAVALGIAAFSWTVRQRWSAVIAGLMATPLLWLMVPGLVGTLISLFTQSQHDPSVQARIERIPRIMAHIRQRPWFGLGNGTWSIQDYFLIDNEIWVTTLERGLLGAIFTFGLLVFAVLLALAVKRLPAVDTRTANLAHAVAAAIAGLAISFATFDAFAYRILTGTLFVLIGVAGALWRLHRPPDWSLLREH